MEGHVEANFSRHVRKSFKQNWKILQFWNVNTMIQIVRESELKCRLSPTFSQPLASHRQQFAAWKEKWEASTKWEMWQTRATFQAFWTLQSSHLLPLLPVLFSPPPVDEWSHWARYMLEGVGAVDQHGSHFLSTNLQWNEKILQSSSESKLACKVKK